MSANNNPPNHSSTDGFDHQGDSDVVIAKWVSAAFQRDFSSLTQAEKQNFRDQYAQLPGDEEGECDDYVDDDMVAEWVGLHYRRNFDHMSEDEKQEYRDRYVEMHRAD